MDLRLWLTAVIICRMHSFIHLSRSNMPIISLQVSWLKGVIFPLSNACCSSSAVIPPLLSASTAYTRDREVTRQRYKTGLNKTQHCKSWRLMNGEQLPILVEHSDHKATRFNVEVGVVPVEECLANLLGSDGIAIILIYCLVIYIRRGWVEVRLAYTVSLAGLCHQWLQSYHALHHQTCITNEIMWDKFSIINQLFMVYILWLIFNNTFLICLQDPSHSIIIKSVVQRIWDLYYHAHEPKRVNFHFLMKVAHYGTNSHFIVTRAQSKHSFANLYWRFVILFNS